MCVSHVSGDSGVCVCVRVCVGGGGAEVTEVLRNDVMFTYCE